MSLRGEHQASLQHTRVKGAQQSSSQGLPNTPVLRCSRSIPPNTTYYSHKGNVYLVIYTQVTKTNGLTGLLCWHGMKQKSGENFS